MAHEIGHAMLRHAVPNEYTNVGIAREASARRGHDFGSWILFKGYNADEYFAEGTAALFGYACCDAGRGDYSPSFLASDEPELSAIVRRTYPGAG
jgi:hypothetical protein